MALPQECRVNRSGSDLELGSKEATQRLAPSGYLPIAHQSDRSRSAKTLAPVRPINRSRERVPNLKKRTQLAADLAPDTAQSRSPHPDRLPLLLSLDLPETEITCRCWESHSGHSDPFTQTNPAG